MLINVSHEEEITIKRLAYKIKSLVKYNGDIIFNNKYSGVNRKCLNSKNLLKKLKWKNKFNLEKGLKIINKKLLKEKIYNI